jgi:hypothetical protein
MNRIIVAEFHKDSRGHLELFSLTAITESKDRGDGKTYVGKEFFDVDYSRRFGYLFHMSGGGGDPLAKVEVRGIYWASPIAKIKEKPTQLVDGNDSPPWKGKKTLAIRKRNRTRRLPNLPQAFKLEPGWDLLNWLENRAINDDAVYCSDCRDYVPGQELCQHCWWCDKTGWYSTPNERCKCKNRDECQGD